MYCASDYRSMARRALKNFWWLAVGVTLLATVLGGGTSSLTVSFQNSDVSRYYPEAMRRFTHVLVPVASVLAMGQFVLRGSISIGHDRFCLKLVDGEQAQFEDLFSAFDIFGSAFVLNLLIALKVFAWSLLFVIPGIIAAYRYSFAMLNLCENPELGVMEALNLSKQQTNGYKMQLFLLQLSFIGWSLLVLGIFLIYELLIAALLPDSFLGIMFGSLLLSVLAAGVGVYLTPYLNLSICRFYLLATAPQVNEPPHFDSWNGNF